MQAVVFSHARGLTLREVPRPSPAGDEVLIRVADTGFCGSDHSLIEQKVVPEETILGHEVSGTIAEAGPLASGVSPGQRVILRPTFCGRCAVCRSDRPHLCETYRRTIGIGDLPGGFAEYVCAPAAMVIPIPPGVDSCNAALAETFASALHGIRRTCRTDGSLLVLGGGPIGLSAVRVAKILGFSPIVLVEPVPEKRSLGEAFGADGALDPRAENLAAQLKDWTGGEGFSTILECSGVAENVPRAVEWVVKGGVICIVSVILKAVTIPLAVLLNLKECLLTAAISNTHAENIQCLRWMAQGRIDARPMVSDVVTLGDLPRIYREKIHPGKAVKVLVRVGEAF